MRKRYPDGKYPYLISWYEIHKGKEAGTVILRDCIAGEDDVLPERDGRYLARLNGRRNPLRIRGFSEQECRRLFEYYEVLLHEPGRHMRIGAEHLFTVYLSAKKYAKTFLPKLINFLLLTLFLPIFFGGAILLGGSLGINAYGYDHFMLGVILGMAPGVVGHELAHAAACLAYGGGWIEAGFLLRGIMPGAYVLLDQRRIKKRLQRVQIDLAGVEMNLFLAGAVMLFAFLGRKNPYLREQCGFWLGVAFQNVMLALINMSFALGLDGEHAMSRLLGSESMVEEAIENLGILFQSKTRKKYFREQGVNAFVNLCCSGFILLSQAAIPLLVVLDVVSLMGGFL